MGMGRLPFMDSPYFVAEVDNWHLTDDAPEEFKREFEKYMSHPDMEVDESNRATA